MLQGIKQTRDKPAERQKMPIKTINVFGVSELIYQDKEFYEAILLETEESGTEIIIQQGDNAINLAIDTLDAFIKSLKNVSIKAKKNAEQNKVKK